MPQSFSGPSRRNNQYSDAVKNGRVWWASSGTVSGIGSSARGLVRVEPDAAGVNIYIHGVIVAHAGDAEYEFVCYRNHTFTGTNITPVNANFSFTGGPTNVIAQKGSSTATLSGGLELYNSWFANKTFDLLHGVGGFVVDNGSVFTVGAFRRTGTNEDLTATIIFETFRT